MVLIDMCGIVTANLCLGLADVPCSLRRPGDAEALCTLEVTFPERTRVVSFGVIASARNCQLNSADRGGYIDTVRGTAIEGKTDLYWLAYRAPQPLDVQSLSFQVRALDGSCFYRGGAERACRVLPGCCCVLCWQLKPSAGETLRLRCVAICNEDIPAEQQQQQQTSAAATRGRIPVRTLSLHSFCYFSLWELPSDRTRCAGWRRTSWISIRFDCCYRPRRRASPTLCWGTATARYHALTFEMCRRVDRILSAQWHALDLLSHTQGLGSLWM